MDATDLLIRSRLFSTVDLVLFSAATWNPHLIHLAQDAATADGLDAPVVQSHFLPAFVLSVLDESDVPTTAGLHQVTWRNRAPVFVGQEVRFALSRQDDAANAWTWEATVEEQLVVDGIVSLGMPDLPRPSANDEARAAREGVERDR